MLDIHKVSFVTYIGLESKIRRRRIISVRRRICSCVVFSRSTGDPMPASQIVKCTRLISELFDSINCSSVQGIVNPEWNKSSIKVIISACPVLGIDSVASNTGSDNGSHKESSPSVSIN